MTVAQAVSGNFGRLIACAALTAVIFIIDLAVPLGFANGVLYVAVILLARPITWHPILFVFAAGCSALIVLGYFLSPPGGEAWLVIANRTISVIAVTVVAVIVFRREQTGNLLRGERAMGAAILRNVGALVVVLDPTGRIIRCNLACEEMTGLGLSEIVGRPIRDFVTPEAAARDLEAGIAAMAGVSSPWQAENFWRTKGGNRRISWSNTPHCSRDGTVEYIVCTGIDVTEHHAAREAVRISEQLYRTVVEAQTDLITRSTPQGILTYVNDVYCDCFGKTREQLIGRSYIALIYPDDVEEVGESIKTRALRTGSKTMELRMIDGGGALRWFIWHSSPVLDEGGGLVEFQSVGRDITDRKRVEEALQQSEERYRLLSDISPDAVMIVCEGKFVFANPAAVELFGAASADDLLGMDILKLVHPDSMAEVLRNREQLEKGAGPLRTESKKYFRLDGSKFFADAALSRLQWNGEPGNMVTLRDTTALVEAQQGLREREERYRQLTDISPSAITVQCEGAVVFANPAAVRLFGARTATDLIGQDALDLIHPKDRALILDLRSKLQGPDESMAQPAAVSFLRLDGSEFTGEGIGTRFRWNGKPAVLNVIHDVTALRQAEAGLRAAKDAAERANTTKSRFLAAASHDLRQPLHALALFLGALSERLQGSAYSELMDKMEQSLESANGLLETVLDISKLDAGVVVPDPNDFSVQIIFDQMATEFSLPAAGNGNRLRVMPCSVTIRSDRVLLENILRNLVSNAVQYTRNGRILVGCRRRPDGLRLEVRDTGAGIPADEQDTIFEEFRRLADRPQSADSGLGLGLAIVERTAKLLGCRVELMSEAGKGSVFTLNVPLGEKIARPAGPKPEIVTGIPPSFRDATVLLIEDDPNILRAIPEYLMRWGCHCVTATSAEGAIAELSAAGRVPDLIMADYHLGDGNTGIDAIRTIQSRWRHIMPSIIVTADTSAEISRRVEQECIPLVYKPAQPAKLRALLLHLLQANASLEMTSTTHH